LTCDNRDLAREKRPLMMAHQGQSQHERTVLAGMLFEDTADEKHKTQI
jgi:hypothetical protein